MCANSWFANLEQRMSMKRPINSQRVLKSQDLVVLLKHLLLGDQRRRFTELAAELSMSASEVHGSVK